jgi:hypothetical protein
MTTHYITLGQELVLNEEAFSGDQVVVNSHGNGNALGNTLVTLPPNPFNLVPNPLGPETLAQFVSGLHLQKGYTYLAATISDSDYGGDAATFIVTDTQSGKIGAISLLGFTDFAEGTLTDHVLTLT